MTRKMRAGVYVRPGTVALAERPLPEPGPGEVRVRITACGVCGTDLHLVHSPQPIVAPGLTLGHEIAGVVDALGPDVNGVACGDPVVVEPLATCGNCGPCRQGRDSICRDLELFGLHRAGGFADAVVVPARRLYPVASTLPPALAALAEPFAVAVHGLRLAGFDGGGAGIGRRPRVHAGDARIDCGPRGRVGDAGIACKPPQRLLILGAGAIGLAVAAVARAWGFDEIRITARYEHQARLAKRLGVQEAIDAGSAGDLDGVDADLVVETVGGTADTTNTAAAALAPAGTICILGVFRGPLTLDPRPLLGKEARLQWSNCYARRPGEADFEEALRLLTASANSYAGLLTHELPLDDIERAFEIAADKRSGAIKVSVVP